MPLPKDHPQYALKYSGYNKKWRANHPEQWKDIIMKRRYKISEETYQAMMEIQNNLCAICDNPETRRANGTQKEGKHRLSVDHNHATGKIRGLLCTKCNLALGHLDDNLNLAIKVVEYLKKHE